jgi:hypothetical protein
MFPGMCSAATLFEQTHIDIEETATLAALAEEALGGLPFSTGEVRERLLRLDVLVQATAARARKALEAATAALEVLHRAEEGDSGRGTRTRARIPPLDPR